MGFLENIAGGVLSGGNQGGGGGLMSEVLGLINNQGGVAGLVQAFQSKGLGDIAASWVGTGANQPVSGDQLQSVLGSGAIGQIAEKLGMSHGAVTDQLSQLLPGVIDHLTPNGQVPQGGGSIGMDMLKGLLARGVGQ